MPSFRVARERAQEVACDLLAVPVYSDGGVGGGAADVEGALGVSIADLLERNKLTGKLGECLAVPTLGTIPAAQVLLVGMGERAKANASIARKAGALVARRAGGAATIASAIPAGARGKADAAAGAFVEGFVLGAYKFDRYKSNGSKGSSVGEVVLLAGAKWDTRTVNKAVAAAAVLGEATNLARDLANTPSGDKSPQTLAEEAKRIAKEEGLKVTVLTEKELKAGGYGGLMGVGQGAPGKPPRLIALEYKPAGAKRHVALVGKGITFDSGGLNIKTSNMDWMKMDMHGAASVLGTMVAVARLKPKVAVTAIICAAENMPSGTAYRPGDVLTMRGGKTVEIGNTDAEGRLVMADGLVYATEHGADVIADVATLTGACLIALGNRIIGVLGEPRSEAKKMLDAAARAGEEAWELPLFAGYRRLLDSDIADMNNVGRDASAGAGTITAGLFLKEFVGDTPWVHLDIAGAGRNSFEEFEIPRGATGAGVRTLVEWIQAM